MDFDHVKGPYIGTGILPSRAMLIVRRLKDMERRLQRPLLIVETGSLRIDSPLAFEGDGHSTLLIAQFLAESLCLHQFVSVDLDTSVCDVVLRRERMRELVDLRTGDSRDVLPAIQGPVDFAYFDSGDGSDAQLMLDEFLILLPKASKDAIFCCDDANVPEKSGALINRALESNLRHEYEERLFFFWPVTGDHQS